MNSSGGVTFEDRQELFWHLVESGPQTLSTLAEHFDVPLDRVRKVRDYLEEVGDAVSVVRDTKARRTKYGKIVTIVPDDSPPFSERKPINPFKD
jgi:hypothetical protein